MPPFSLTRAASDIAGGWPTTGPAPLDMDAVDPVQAEAILAGLAEIFSSSSTDALSQSQEPETQSQSTEPEIPHMEAMYRALVEQIPAVIFMAYLDRGIGEAYVSPQIETSLGFSQEEWLEDPIRWYERIHPEDKARWSLEAAEMFLSGKPLRSSYRVLARDGRVIWFHCEAKMIRKPDGRPWFIHGVGFDISDLKRTEKELQEERNVVSAILHTVGALVVVLDPEGRIIRFNRACEQISGYSSAEVEGRYLWDLFMIPDEAALLPGMFEQLRTDQVPNDYESYWITREGARRLISWSCTLLSGTGDTPTYIIASGIDITERKRLEAAILEVSSREQRRIGQDLHDGLGQHLTGIAFMSKVQEHKLAEKNLPEAADAAKIVRLVNEAIHTTRELARGLLPVVSDEQGLMSALRRYASEVEDVFGVTCRFRSDEPVLIQDYTAATHLYHVAQEAVNNAIKHGHAQNIVIYLGLKYDQGTLSIEDDGVGIPEVPHNSGMGLQIMNHRAGMIGGTLQVKMRETQGTVVMCQFPIRNMEP